MMLRICGSPNCFVYRHKDTRAICCYNGYGYAVVDVRFFTPEILKEKEGDCRVSKNCTDANDVCGLVSAKAPSKDKNILCVYVKL